MSQYREFLCVVKARGCAAVVVSLREGYEYESLGETIATRPLDGFCTLRIAYDAAAGDELDGPLVVTGVGTEGRQRSLDLGEAERIAAQFPACRTRARTDVIDASADENVVDDAAGAR